jgi:hypothetical protein
MSAERLLEKCLQVDCHAQRHLTIKGHLDDHKSITQKPHRVCIASSYRITAAFNGGAAGGATTGKNNMLANIIINSR